MHGSPPHPAGSERGEPVPGMISGGAPPAGAAGDAQTGPASVADQQTAHVMAVAASSRPAPVGQARTARHQPPACEGITRRTAGRAWLPDLPVHW